MDLVDSFDASSRYFFNITITDRFSWKGMMTDEIKINITEVNRNAEATLKFFGKDKSSNGSEILKLIGN